MPGMACGADPWPGIPPQATFFGIATNCTDATAFINLIVGAEVKGVVIGYEAENEPAPYAIPCVRAAASAATVPAAAASVGSRVRSR